MLAPSAHRSCRLTQADHARLGLLRDRCRGLIDRAHGSIHQSAVLLRHLPWRPAVPDWPVPEPATAAEADVAELWELASAASRAAHAVVERAARQVARAVGDVERARQLRHQSRVLRRAHLALGPLPPPVPGGAGGGIGLRAGCGGRRPAPAED